MNSLKYISEQLISAIFELSLVESCHTKCVHLIEGYQIEYNLSMAEINSLKLQREMLNKYKKSIRFVGKKMDYDSNRALIEDAIYHQSKVQNTSKNPHLSKKSVSFDLEKDGYRDDIKIIRDLSSIAPLCSIHAQSFLKVVFRIFRNDLLDVNQEKSHDIIVKFSRSSTIRDVFSTFPPSSHFHCSTLQKFDNMDILQNVLCEDVSQIHCGVVLPICDVVVSLRINSGKCGKTGRFFYGTIFKDESLKDGVCTLTD